MDWPSLAWWTMHVAGLDNASGPWYLFWSGIGADISEITLVGAAIVFWRNHTCHVNRCWRFGRHEHFQDGVTLRLCRKHHPSTDEKLWADAVKAPDDTPR